MLPFNLRTNKLFSIDFRNVFSHSRKYVLEIQAVNEPSFESQPIEGTANSLCFEFCSDNPENKVQADFINQFESMSTP